ncbi:MAG: hypothetical protein HQM13_22950 [SAR324 cluster bacterium]|nr:hypothetical protein [SAR324 cluster bacterium]
MLRRVHSVIYQIGAVCIGTLLLAACSGSTSNPSEEMFVPSFLSRLKTGDRHIGWALTYFESWRRDRQPRYLFLAEDHIYNAVDGFARLQSDTSPRISEFYVVRERRVRSCRFLAELQFDAVNYGVALRRPSAIGCTF